MCGILTLFSASGQVERSLLERGLDVIGHRGPDNRGTWIAADGRVGLGHTRLSIMGLETGDQPLSSEQDGLHLVVNGEFYDFEKIRTQLQAQGYAFRTESDSEIALHLYHRYGTAALAHLRGEFAFCLWDEASQTLFAARDRFGIKPLYYTVQGDTVLLSSEIKALLAAGVPAGWDVDAYLSRAFFFRDRTLFKDIHQVPPGHFLLATAGGVRLGKYWDFNYLPPGREGTDEQTAVADLRAALLEAVETRLRADVPVGVYLSGGIDSCAVLGMAAHLRQAPIDTFTLSFSDRDYDEAALARSMAEKAGARHHCISVTQDDLADNFAEAIRHGETLLFNAHGVAKFQLSKYVREFGLKVVLTGEGADEIFAGYSAFRGDAILTDAKRQAAGTTAQALEELKARNKVSAGLLLPTGTGQQAAFIRRLLGYEPAWLLPLAEIFTAMKQFYHADTLRRLGEVHPIQQFLQHLDYNRIAGVEPVHASMYMMSKAVLPNYVLTNLGDRMEMAHSIEGRLPFLDHRVVEMVTPLPVGLKIKGKTEKYLLREAVRPFVIDAVYKRQKHPFLAPPSVIAPHEKFYQLVQDTLRGTVMDSLPFFDKKAVVGFLDKVPSLPQNAWPQTEALLLELMSLCCLQKHFNLGSQ
ncbi:asparagine synthase (glutamine-hydrolyzing) [Exilibacterium tricleocarpae]|uniref:asparagine synthase (glutamine-hydrolyzing) n=1 Tax=Exilibacterium tricleocarpae TaxID=2591008 RepID=A0A545U8A8_9GAMM|nr:asparagine synthase (glutamine-hydrolyzing) [Exilibacterium tricleocarpae]TQV85701.1 asparagine synthase (glutamine-hydrolyzing) [Exilibacterium tricleocarpae]